MCICAECNLSGESCVCQEVSRCISCEHYDFVIGCTLEPPEDCVKEGYDGNCNISDCM